VSLVTRIQKHYRVVGAGKELSWKHSIGKQMVLQLAFFTSVPQMTPVAV
jgi:hypothetical protein